MKTSILLIFVCFLAIGHAQTIIKIIDKNGPLPLAKIAYSLHNNTVNKYILSDINGLAKINESENLNTDLCIKISHIGYDTITDIIKLNSRKTYVLNQTSEFINEVCVTGELAPTLRKDAINKIKIIKKEDIINSGASSLKDILVYQTNMRIQQDNILGSGLSMGGMSGENVKILQDGVPMIGRLNGNVDLSQINLDNVERIEIVNGPLSVNYGTNALAGTINIITKQNVKPGWNANLQGYYQSVGEYNLSGNIAYRYKRHTVKMSGGRKYFDGWDPKASFITIPKKTVADTNRSLQWNPKLQYFGDFQYIISIKQWRINPYFRYYYEKIANRGYPSLPYYEEAFDDYYYTRRIDQGITIDKPLKKGQFKTILAYNYFKRTKQTYFKDLTTLQQKLAGDQDTSIFDLFIARSSYSSKYNKWFNFQIGTDINIESSHGKRIKDQTQSIGDYAAYSSLQLSFLNEKIIIKPGARYIYNTLFNAPITPSINIKLNNKSFYLRASIAKGFRSPTIKELYFNFVDINHNIQGNLNLIPESSINFNGTFSWLKSKPSPSGYQFNSEISLFYNTFSNLVTLAELTDGSLTYTNIGEYATKGIQSEIAYQRNNINIKVNGAYVGRYNFTQVEDLPNYIYSPEIGLNSSYKFLKKKYTINLFYKYNGKLLSYYLDQNDNLFSNRTSHYHIIDLSIGRSFLKNNLKVVIGGKNLLNVKNITVTGLSNSGVHSSGGNLAAARGTSFFVSINYKIKSKP